MKKIGVVGKLMVGGLLAAASVTAQAQTVTGNMNVTATVQSTCVIDSVPDLDFGTYLGSTGARNAQTSFNVTCANTVPYSLSFGGYLGAGAPRVMLNGTSELGYQLYQDAGRSTVWSDFAGGLFPAGTVGTGLAQQYTVYGRLFDDTANRLAPAGAYNAVVVVTVTY